MTNEHRPEAGPQEASSSSLTPDISTEGSVQAEARIAPEQASSTDAVEKYDRESRTRDVWSTKLALPLTIFAVGLSLYQIYYALFGGPPTLVHRAIHVGAILVLCFAVQRFRLGEKRRTPPWYDWLFIAGSIAIVVYLAVVFEKLTVSGGRFDPIDVVFSSLCLLLVLEAARRVTGPVLPILAVLFIVYDYYGRSMPGLFRHRGYDLDQIVTFMYESTEGIFSTAIGVSSTYIFLFILFGAILQKSGMGQFFNDIAMALAGQARGGPAKVAVLASGFLGSINGSAIANVVTTGAFTIPMMKRVGYHRNFAGAVESAASVGGQIMPPIMGAAAFIMSETLGIPYTQIVLVAIIPAVLYYLAILIQVHLRATSQGLSGISRENLPAVMEVMKARGHLLLPLLFLLYMLFFSGTTILFAAVTTIFVTVAAAMVRKTTRMSMLDIVHALRDGALTAVSVAVACACVGIIVGVATQTGFGVKLAGTIVTIGGGFLLPTLLMTAVACIILGMGLPSIPAYIIVSTMAAPALVQLEVPALAAHLFVFYFGLFANITPPVALAAFAAAGLSGGSPMRTGFLAMRLALGGLIVPFVFVYQPELLMLDGTLWDTARATVILLIGVCLIAVAAEGQLFVPLPPWLRGLLVIGAIGLVTPSYIFDLIGAVVAVAALAITMVMAKRQDRLAWREI
ncbi:MAG: TRAP transporter permease [Brevibacterium sp.]|uniref:TRAP transporter, 4TM/12TM fusion protein n=1 Tax=Brevibacterium antiquum CNRZ 918 TaxID=1255637 RepID=A0A2H1ICB0_9MICO|nr:MULTISPECIES: TRAP transporter permease [Brevibacterium]MDN5808126.1 TRAP transporter permease [Brevibacterium sp.]MDN5877291.1 TRAP transporter permease [Brevibacterium sp.]MDN5910235.1 TRAP transporter permease [Brevibacterium sp.]MDN6134599.1 TRAP transporter permease [Brevibacterium sp.]MDN6158880.1 TRAP transporter permease [Brevibacterium sp.]